jgi:hypothetical protein
MNTANLQMEGLLLALGSLLRTLKDKELLSSEEIERMLVEAENRATRPEGFSPANANAVLFPIRFLARDLSGEDADSYTSVTAGVGRDRRG